MKSKFWLHHIISRKICDEIAYLDVCWMLEDGKLMTSKIQERVLYEEFPVMVRFFLMERGIRDPYVSMYTRIRNVYAIDHETSTAWVKYERKKTMRVSSKFLFAIRPDLRKQVPLK